MNKEFKISYFKVLSRRFSCGEDTYLLEFVLISLAKHCSSHTSCYASDLNVTVSHAKSLFIGTTSPPQSRALVSLTEHIHSPRHIYYQVIRSTRRSRPNKLNVRLSDRTRSKMKVKVTDVRKLRQMTDFKVYLLHRYARNETNYDTARQYLNFNRTYFLYSSSFGGTRPSNLGCSTYGI